MPTCSYTSCSHYSKVCKSLICCTSSNSDCQGTNFCLSIVQQIVTEDRLLVLCAHILHPCSWIECSVNWLSTLVHWLWILSPDFLAQCTKKNELNTQNAVMQMHPFVLEQKHGSAMTSSSLAHSERSCFAVRHIEYVYFTVYTWPCKPSSKNTGNFFNQYNKRKSTYGKISVQGCPIIVPVFYPPSKTSSALWDLMLLFLEQLWNSKFLKWKELQNCLKISNLRAHVSH